MEVVYPLAQNQYYVPINSWWIPIFWVFLVIIIITGLLVWMGSSNKTTSVLPSPMSIYGANLPVGATCDSNSQCNNNVCGYQSGATGAPLICCPSGQSDLFGGFNFCTQIPNGSPCWSDAMCASGVCIGNEGGVTRGVCNGPLPTGAVCSSDNECSNNTCGKQSAATGAPSICCPSCETETFGDVNYCTQISNGLACWSDSMCNSNNCVGNVGGSQRGICNNPLPTGAACTNNDECGNGVCGKQSAATGAPNICCPSGQLTEFADSQYCTQLVNGSVCWSNEMCVSGNCSRINNSTRGICTQ